MPNKLNALIRYKIINASLYGGKQKLNLMELKQVCSEGLTGSRAREEYLSERTIFEDLQQMKSNTLGFNAPVDTMDGLYFYTNPRYSIFNIRLADSCFIRKTIDFLLQIREEVDHPELEIILERLIGITPEFWMAEVNTGRRGEAPESYLGDQPKRNFYKSAFKNSMIHDFKFNLRYSIVEKPVSSLTWGDVLLFI